MGHKDINEKALQTALLQANCSFAQEPEISEAKLKYAINIYCEVIKRAGGICGS